MDLISAIFRPEVMVFMVPITAIAGHYFYRAQKLKAEGQISGEERKMLSHVMHENENLRDRVENLESIVTGLEDKLLLQADVNANGSREHKLTDSIGKD